MNIDKKLAERSGEKCEMCAATSDLSAYHIQPGNPKNNDENVVVCATCLAQINDATVMDANHWRCLNDSMWSEVPAVQVLSWRMLSRLKAEGWPQDLLDMMYLDEDNLKWAQATGEGISEEDVIVHRDSNGAILQNGDTVTLTKELDVKGATFSAKRGTAVRNIRLVHDNPEQIEGKIEGQSIVILTQYVKK
jgi:protein PhnA